MAPIAAVASKPAATPTRTVSVDVDLVRSYLRDIGRVPLLTHEQEITLGRQVQELMDLEATEAELESRDGGKPTREQLAKASGLNVLKLKRKFQNGRRAKERMVAANLRLVVSVARSTPSGIWNTRSHQEGTIGLVRGEKFDPTQGYKFSTYAYWWIRRASPEQSRRKAARSASNSITEMLNKLKGQRELNRELGRTPTVAGLLNLLNCQKMMSKILCVVPVSRSVLK